MELFGQSRFSPLFISVALILSIMTISAIIAFWSSSFFRQSIPGFNQTNIDCQNSGFIVYQCYYSSSTGDITFIIFNTKSATLRNLVAHVVDSSGNPGTGIPLNGTVSSASYVSYSLSNISQGFSRVSVSSMQCPGLVADSACS